MKTILKKRDFRLLFTGQAVSFIGDQFHLIALPWLVLTLTHDPLQLGAVLAVAGIPRALLMLVGGVWADRHSPRTIMLISDALRFIVTAGLAIAVLAGTAQIWMVYVLAGVFGVVSGFFMPAAQAALPRVVDEAQLEGGNAFMMGANQLAAFVGPVAAGLLIATFGSGATAGAAQAASLTGIGVAFAVDAASFLISAVALLAMHPIAAAAADADAHPVRDVVEGLRYALGSAHLRGMLVILSAANFLVAGPMFVGMPVLAQLKLGGAAAFGMVMSAYGFGSLAGMGLAAGLPRPSDRAFGWLGVALLIGFAGAMAALGYVTSTWVAVALMVATGIGNGFIGVHAITSLQRMTAEKYLGRVMSLITLAMVGLMPVSQALSGVVIRISPEALFLTSGAGFTALALWAATKRDIWTIDPSAKLEESTATDSTAEKAVAPAAA